MINLLKFDIIECRLKYNGDMFDFNTIVATLLLGPTIQFFLPIVERPVKKFLGTSTAIV